MGLLIFGLVMFVLLVVLHEYGHFLVAKRNGVDVEEFGVGFPPKLYGRKMGKGIFEGYYTVNLLPLGGFVRLKGEHDADKQKGAYGAASTPAKMRIMLAGVAMNLAAAFVLFTIVAWVGMPQVVPDQFNVNSDSKISRSNVLSAYIINGSPAEAAGLQNGDIISTFDGIKVTTAEQLNILSQQNAGKAIDIEYIHKGETSKTRVQLLSQADSSKYQEKSFLGVILGKDNQGAVLTDILKGSAAEAAGLQKNDVIVGINNNSVGGVDDLKVYTKQFAGQNVVVAYSRDGVKKTAEAKLLTAEEILVSGTNQYFGFSPSEYTLKKATWSAPIVAIGSAVQFTKITLQGLGSALSNIGKAFVNAITGNGNLAKEQASKAGQNVSGPVGIFAILQQGSALGYQFILFVIALISLTLAIMNFLPIPALDGGRAFVTLLYRAMKKPLTPKAEEMIHGTGFAALMILFLVITVVDIKRFF